MDQSLKKVILMEKNMIRLMLEFQKLYLPIFPVFKLGGKSKYKNEIIEKPIINETGENCTEEKITLICQLILRLQFLWIIIFTLIFFYNLEFNLIIN